MKNLLTFIGLTIKGGLLVLLPLLLFILLLREIVELVQEIAAPIVALFPAGTFDDAELPLVLAVLLIAGVSLLIGIAMKSTLVQKMGGWIEKETLENLPIYKFVKTIVSGLVGGKDVVAFKPALFDSGDGQQEFVYVVETLEDGRLIVLFPMAPTGFAGPVRIVLQTCITPIAASLGDVSLILNHMGLGTGRLLKKNSHQDNEKKQ